MNSVHIVSGIGDEASGLAYAVPKICQSLNDNGVCTQLFSCDPPTLHRDDIPLKTFPVLGPWKHKTGYSPALYRRLAEIAASSQIFHNHHLWMLPNVYPAFAIRNTKCKLITSLHGTLAPQALKHSRWRKNLMWYLGQSKVLTRAACLIATSEVECADIRRVNLKAPIAIIPLGYDPPKILAQVDPPSRRRVLYLGRIHPIKGIYNLVEAWAAIENRFPDWELHMVGPGRPEHIKDTHDQIRSKGLVRAFLREGVYGEEKSFEYLRAEVCVLPSFSENFGMTVAEALGHSRPVIVSKGAPWEGIEKNKCGWWIDIGVEPLVEALESACSSTVEALSSKGQLGRIWVSTQFSWNRIGLQLRDVYSWVLESGGKPCNVQSN